jgi:hypothetical protein
MTRAAALILGSSLALAAAAPGLAQSSAERALAGAADVAAEPVEVRRTPSQVEEPWLACRDDVDCEPSRAGERSRPSRRWTVRSSGIPADAEPQPHYPIAIIADVDAEKPQRRGRPRR